MKSKPVLAALFMLSLPTVALAYCSEPSAPYCASGFGSFGDQYEFDRCKREMESYQSEVSDFGQCQQREMTDLIEAANNSVNEAKRKVESVNSSYSDAVESFNRRASN